MFKRDLYINGDTRNMNGKSEEQYILELRLFDIPLMLAGAYFRAWAVYFEGLRNHL